MTADHDKTSGHDTTAGHGRTAGASDGFDVIHAQLIARFAEIVSELGGDPGGLLNGAGIDPARFADGAAQVTYRQMVTLLEAAADSLRCPDFAMRLAARQGGIAVFGPLGAVMKNSRSFGEALAYVDSHNYAHSLAARVRVMRLPDNRGAFVRHDILLEGVPRRAQALELILLAGHLGAMEITDGHARARRIHFRHQPVSPPRLYRRYFGCEVRFGQNEEGIFYSARDLACPIADPDAQAYQAAAAFIETHFTRQRPPLHAETRGIIMQLLGSDLCGNDHVAGELGLHPRTLHRRLRAEGTSFQKIKDEVRRDFLAYYLRETDLDFTRIAERLGFSEQAVLTRNCNRWFGAPPSHLRARAG